VGMDQSVVFTGRATPGWPAVRERLTGLGYAVQVRMIDGELAFPDEEPPEVWRELRLGTPEGMVTLRRSPEGVTFVTWGNAEGALRQAWNALTWAYADVGDGTIQSPQGAIEPREFRQTADLPQALREG
jgi:hypothetical protein